MNEPLSPARRRLLQALAAAPFLTMPALPAAGTAARRWTATGTRIARYDAIDRAIESLMRENDIRAASFAVSRLGRPLFRRGYTWAEADYPVTQPDSPMRLAGLTEIFTAALVEELILAKGIEPDTTVFPYLGLTRAVLPGQAVDPRLETITVQHLIDHSGGWDSTKARDPMFRMRQIAQRLGLQNAVTSRDIAQFMAGEPLQFDPGTHREHASFGYLLLGLVCERAAGMEYLRALNKRVTAKHDIAKVFLARTSKDRRLRGEGFYDDPVLGLTAEFPTREVHVEAPYGGGDFLMEAGESAFGLAAGAGAVAQLLGHYAATGRGPRKAGSASHASLAGSAGWAASRRDDLDWCLIMNKRYDPEAQAVAARIDALLGAAG
jgi:CubicO group peptidase (beta-lactamase class C family)